MLATAVITLWLALAFYAGATVLYAYQAATKRAALAHLATAVAGAGLVLHTASIGLRSVATNGTELTGANVLVLMAWALVLVYFILERVARVKVYGAVIVPIALAMLCVAQLLGAGRADIPGIPPQHAELLESWRVGIHVALIVFANAGYAVSAVASSAYLVLERQLKHHTTSKLFRRMPPLAQTDTIARRAIVWAYPAYTAGLLLGILRAVETGVGSWWADPRVVLAVLVWLVFGAYQLLRWRRDWPGRPAAYLALAGCTLAALLAIVARTVPAGFHVFGL